MITQNHSENDRGQVGIGTLIVFIAMVLVAAIAAGVLINTAGSLQSQASNTGTETQQTVANQIEVIHAVAETQADGADSVAVPGSSATYTDAEEFDELRLTVKKSAGSDVIDLTSTTVQYTSGDSSLTLAHHTVYGDTDGGDSGPHFATEAVAGDTNGDSLTNADDRVNVIIPLIGGTHQPTNLDTGDSVTVELVDQSGAKYTYGVTMPQTVSDEQTVVQV